MVTFSDGTNSVAVDAILGATGWIVPDVDLSDLTDGSVTATAVVTDFSGNTATATDALTLDTSADADATALNIDVVASDEITNASEVGHVSTTLSGVDSDATSVVVTFTDGTNTVTVNAIQSADGSWSVADTDLSTLNDGNIIVEATVTDLAGNIAVATDTLDLDTSADVDNNFGITIAAGDVITNALEVGHVSTTLTGVDADADSVKVSFTDGTTTVTVDATNDGSGWTVPDVDLSTLANGDIKVTATVTDDAGNTKDIKRSNLRFRHQC